MAFAAVALFASCDMLDNNQNDDQNQEPAALSVDGKVWTLADYQQQHVKTFFRGYIQVP